MSRHVVVVLLTGVLVAGCTGANHHDPSTWDIEADEQTIRRSFNAVRLIFKDHGAQAGFAAMGERVWQALTAEQVVDC